MIEKISTLARFCGFVYAPTWNPFTDPLACGDLKRKIKEAGETYEIQCGRGLHGAMIGGRVELWAQGESDEEALCEAVLAWLEGRK